MADTLSGKTEKSGILLVEKPRDMTSFGVVSRLRRLIGEKKIGHTGTLDPFAEGLLAVCVGKATSVVQFMDTYDKSYRVHILFGQATDTMDLTGTVIEDYVFKPGELQAMRAAGFSRIFETVESLVGSSQQLPPMYSAVKIDGQPLYKLAREGQTIERQKRPITIYSAHVNGVDCRTELESEGPYLAVDLTLMVSKGTYIRVIADELGRNLGWFAHAIKLERLTVGPFRSEQSVTLSELDNLFETQNERRNAQDFVWQTLVEQGRVHDMAEALADLPALKLPLQLALRLAQGQKIVLSEAELIEYAKLPFKPKPDQRLTVHCLAGLLGVIHLRPETDEINGSYRLISERIFLTHERLLPA